MEWIGQFVLVALAIKLVHNFLHFIYTALLGSLLGHNLDLAKCGPWAVATGSTDGIGKAFAKKVFSFAFVFSSCCFIIFIWYLSWQAQD